jgi:hypothetical protein
VLCGERVLGVTGPKALFKMCVFVPRLLSFSSALTQSKKAALHQASKHFEFGAKKIKGGQYVLLEGLS